MGVGILSQIQAQAVQPNGSRFYYWVSVSEPLSYQETFAVMEIFLLLHAGLLPDFMQRNMRGKIIVSITAFHSNDLDSCTGINV